MEGKRYAFTLLEMMLVVALCATTVAYGGYAFSDWLYRERFERGVEEVCAKLALAQELALDYRMDVSLSLTRGNGGVYCHLTPGRPIGEALGRRLNQKEKIETLDQFGLLRTSGEPEKAYTDQLDLHFDGTLGTTPSGTLILAGRGIETQVALRGFPSEIGRGEYVDHPPKATYPQALLSAY